MKLLNFGSVRTLFRRRAARQGTPDPLALQRALGRAHLGRRYGPRQRWQDFRAVLTETPEGQRVLWQLLEWSRLYRPVAVHDEPHMTYFRDGERNMGLRVLATLNAEPPAADSDGDQSGGRVPPR